MKKSVSLALALTMTASIALTGCGKTETPKETTSIAAVTATTAATPEPKKDEKFSIRMYWWGSQTRHDYTMKIADMFKQKYPGSTIDYEYSAWDGYFDKLAANVAANNAPDLIQMDRGNMNQYAKSKSLADLSPFIKSGVIDTKNVDAPALENGKIGEQMFGITLGVNSQAIVYDPEIFKKANVPVPEASWTWADFEKYGLEFTKQGIFAIDQMPGYQEFYIRKAGQHMFNKDGTALGFDEKTYTEFLKLYARLIKEKVVTSPEDNISVKGIEDSFIVTKKAAMSVQWSNQVVSIANAAKRPLALALLPNGESGSTKGQYLTPAMFFSVAESSKYKDAVCKFINYFINDVEANKLIGGDRGVPISSAVRTAMLPTLNDTQKLVFEYIDKASKNSSPMEPLDPPGAKEVTDLSASIQSMVIYGKLTPEQGAADFIKQANAILAKNKK